ncbi:MAG: DUF262 domain-containing protein [Bacteroidales bacterium]|nr:DUF262 domain-containing protein [Bacteroidales bacterium]
MATQTIYESERLSFYKIFSERNYKVIIPKIQREYAQGRKSSIVSEVREEFLNAIYVYLEENIPNRDLDFVYGNVQEIEGEKTCFIPLDGQQRLTTLFLLHWYLLQISSNEELKNEYLKNLVYSEKSNFCYETRSSSTDFCNKLMTNHVDMDNLRLDENDKQSVELTIKNKNWYYSSWNFDPTIQSMLVMLDAIHNKFSTKPEFFERLLDKEKPIITFLFMDLKKYKLTDELYIKMNSRGKPLTSFENFKAKYEQYLEQVDDKKESFYLFFDGVKTKVDLKKYFSHKIDTTWTNLVWNFNKSYIQDRNHLFDQKLVNFIRVILTNYVASVTTITQKEKDITLDALFSTEELSFNRYLEIKALSLGASLYLIKVLDRLSGETSSFSPMLNHNYTTYFDEVNTLKNALSNKFTSHNERLCFYAYINYLITYNSTEGINDWMRVIHNLSHPENTPIDNYSEFAAYAKEIEKLLSNGNKILEYLKTNPMVGVFPSWQVKEECIKACLILKGDKWRQAIEAVEKHGYFNGQIGFILSFSGIIKYYEENNNCDWSQTEDDSYYKRFNDYVSKASVIFANNYENRINDVNYCFERAVLTKGDYLMESSSGRWNMLSTNKVSNNIKRDYSWKRFLRLTDDKDILEQQQYVKEVFDDVRFDVNKVVSSLEDICKDGASDSDWRDVIIKNQDIIKYSGQGFLCFDDGNEGRISSILIYKESKSSHYHTELFTYNMWKSQIEQLYNQNPYPFESVYYYYSKTETELPCIVFSDFIYNRVKYSMEIYAKLDDDEWNIKNYVIWFYKNKEGEIHSVIKKGLTELGFDDEFNYYSNDVNVIFSVIEKIYKKLKDLR